MTQPQPQKAIRFKGLADKVSTSGPAFVDIHNNPRVDLIRGHVGYVYVLLSNNNYLISGSGDSTIKVSVKGVSFFVVDVVVGRCGTQRN